MKLTILYPGSYFDRKKVDEDYELEYQEAVKFQELQIAFFNYDEFMAGDRLKLFPLPLETGLCIYRGWMVKPEKYQALYEELRERGLELINTPKQYENCHEFPRSYPLLKDFTPSMLSFPEEKVISGDMPQLTACGFVDPEQKRFHNYTESAGQKGMNCGRPLDIDWDQTKAVFPRFMIKDYVKSVKGTSFPAFFDSTYSNKDLDQYLEQFKQLRGELYTGGIVIKEFVDLKRVNGITNEYRAFYLNGRLLTLSPNSNQRFGAQPPKALTDQLPLLESRFYNVDFAEQEDGHWMVIETGDGQVSGLSPGQYIFKFYEELLGHAL